MTETATVLYHAVGNDWAEGDDLLAWDELYTDLGDWKWGEGQGTHSTHVVTMTTDLVEALWLAEEFALTRVLTIELPADELDTNVEGYPTIDRVPTANITGVTPA